MTDAFIIQGQVRPDFFEVTFEGTYHAHFPAMETFPGCKFSLTIKASRILVEGNAPREFEDWVFIRVMDVATALANLMALRVGYALTADLLSIQWGSNPPSHLARALGSGLPTSYTEADFHPVFSLIMSEHTLLLALRDLAYTMEETHSAPLVGGRVADTIRNLLAPGKDVKSGWAIVQSTLRVDETFLRLLTSNSVKPRHGENVRITGDVTRAIARHALQLFDRYLHLRLKGLAVLPASEFPILTH